MKPRPYQEKAVEKILLGLTSGPDGSHLNQVLVMPTGSGKTFTATLIVNALRACEMSFWKPKPVLWLAHRRELIQQAVEALRRYDISVGVIMAGEPPNPDAHVQVASIQTLNWRLRKGPPPPAELIVIDEAHHARAASYEKIIAAYPETPRLGLTATPFRLDGRGLGASFDRIIVAATTAELVKQGTLHEPTVYAPAVPNLKGVRKRGGEFRNEDLAECMGESKLIGDIVKTYNKITPGRRAVVFAVNIRHSQSIVEAFREDGVTAEHIDGSTPKGKREATLDRLRSGYTRIVSQCAVLTEGWDLPALEVAILARPTASLCLHLQMVGRIMRTADLKVSAVVLDHAGNHIRHGFVSQELAYSLADGAASPKGAAADGVAGKRCLGCYLLVAPRLDRCPGCGWEFPLPPLPVVSEGELQIMKASGKLSIRDQQVIWDRLTDRSTEEGKPKRWAMGEFKRITGITPLVVGGKIKDPADASDEEKRSSYLKLRRIQMARGYAHGWVGVQFMHFFGHWPRFESAEKGG